MKREPMSWEECSAKHIRKVEIDTDKVNSILKLCAVRLRVVKLIPLDAETASVIAEHFYEIMKELLIALLLLHTIKSDNHECLIAFFKKTYPEKEYETKVMYDLKAIRHKIDYEGLFVGKGYIERNRLEFIHIISFLQDEIQGTICFVSDGLAKR
ncbi:TPA: hypothetical protein HA242_04210 [Candidatus Woesearchaeota archaeon]|nr:hypothetical protein [Candidatus Woesearchaeota archaeon]HIH12902.1 hypothetical protein [Candidatus Woesearchaeota archaeon]